MPKKKTKKQYKKKIKNKREIEGYYIDDKGIDANEFFKH